MTRRDWLRGAGALGALAAFGRFAPTYAWAGVERAAAPVRGGVAGVAAVTAEHAIDLVIDGFPLDVNGRAGKAIAVNGSVPGPLVLLREGEEAVLRVTNRLREISSIHWHGLILPPEMDGVPGISFRGIAPGETFTYRFPVRQSGTYWAHSHSGGQELLGLYFPLVILPREPEPFLYDRDYVVMLSDWSFESPATIIGRLKKQAGYYNFQRRTLADFARDVRNNGWSATLRERLSWSKMRMDPTDFADVTGYTYTYLMNGLAPEANWTGLFRAGERVRLRFIDAGAMTYFDVRIPGLKMTVVQADGQNVRPIEVDEFRIGPGETFDVVVEPGERAYTVFAESMDRSGYARGTLAPQLGMSAPLPARRPRPLRTMRDMGMDMSGMEEMGGTAGEGGAQAGDREGGAGPPGMDIAGHSMSGMGVVENGRRRALARRDATQQSGAGGMDMGAGLRGPSLPGSPPVMHGRDTHGPGNSSVAMVARSRLDEPGSGFEHAAGRVLVYADLRSVAPQPDGREPVREIELHITGNMERYMWSFDGKKYSEASRPIPFRHGERLRLVFVNDTMMEHPIHLHGMWMELENGGGEHQPRKHTVSVKPAERLTVAVTADAPGRWAMHCHLLLHLEMGMLRVVEVSPEAHS
ncbi:MAG TPA: copper resistance system multicopper oxidase [Blastocatellia bacterium]|nr:copper resistance system multicopper oxidase [Blastocatellia bacterium]